MSTTKKKKSDILSTKGSKSSMIRHQVRDDTSDNDTATWINVQRVLGIIARDNPNDPYKPYSHEAIHDLATNVKRKELKKDQEEMLQNTGADYDITSFFDTVDPPGANTFEIPASSKAELVNLPMWLRTYIEVKFPNIYKMYQEDTPTLFRLLAKRLEYRKMKGFKILPHDDDVTESESDDEIKTGMGAKKTIMKTKTEEDDPFEKPDILNVVPEEQDLDLWNPRLLQEAVDALRAVMLAGASESEGEDPGESEWIDDTAEIEEMRKKRRTLITQHEEDAGYQGPHWEDVVAEKEHLAEQARWKVGMNFVPEDQRRKYFFKNVTKRESKPKVRKGKDKESDEKKKKEKKKNKTAKSDLKKKYFFRLRTTGSSLDEDWEQEIEQQPLSGPFWKAKLGEKYYSHDPGHPLYQKPKDEISHRAKHLRERGVGKRPSRIYFKEPGKGPITHVTRTLHQIRSFESVHAYVNLIAHSSRFRNFIMLVIFLNAIILAGEVGESAMQYVFLVHIFDSIFLSIYVVEFGIKFYANPVQYFKSGYNVFDFVILIASLTRISIQWIMTTQVWWLRYFIIIRALRILRAVGLSIHTQVLVTALVSTLKNHVLSVVVLLLLMMYIAAIVALYLFAQVPALKETWGSVPNGLLRLFSFVTMDGWTELVDQFEEQGLGHMGRIFCIICAVFGNFLFSNIFIAIIIMQISEATDTFRKTQSEERESRVFLKQEAVFRRQLLDMRQLLARQKLGITEDFFDVGSKFVGKLRHDDLVDTKEIIFSPLWIDALYKGMQREHHTSNILMNLHRKMSDHLVKLNNLYDEEKSVTRGITRSRYNRYLEIKAKLALLKEEFLIQDPTKIKRPVRIRLPPLIETQEHAKPPPPAPPMPKKSGMKHKKKIH